MPRYINPVPQYLNGSGEPIVNGKLTFYKSGTTTPIITYADSPETIANTNPVNLNADGSVPNIFFSGLARVVCTYDDLETGEIGKQLFDKDPVGAQSSLGDFESWDSQVVYDLNDIVEGGDGKFYKSITNSNQGNDPESSQANWEEIRFISVYNENVTYQVGEIAQTLDGNLWASQQIQSANDPSTDDGSNWLPAVDSDVLTRWVSLTASGTLSTNNGYYILATGATTELTQPVFTANDILTIKNSISTTQTVRLLNPSNTIIGPSGTINAGDDMIINAGSAVQLIARTSSILEVVSGG